MDTKLTIHPVFDTDSHTITYIVADSVTKKCAVIDPVLDYNHRNVQADTVLADQVITIKCFDAIFNLPSLNSTLNIYTD